MASERAKRPDIGEQIAHNLEERNLASKKEDEDDDESPTPTTHRKRGKAVAVRFNDTEYKLIAQMAEAEHTTVSGLIRQFTMAQIKATGKRSAF
jgi:hypothetical protein